jgi:hypothetical protein
MTWVQWHMKIRVFRIPDCDIRIIQNKFEFYKLLSEIPEQNSGFGYFEFGFFRFGFRITGFLPSPTRKHSRLPPAVSVQQLAWNATTLANHTDNSQTWY